MHCSRMVRSGDTSIHSMSCATPWSWRQTNQQQCFPPTEDAFKEQVLCAKCHALIWCKSHVPNQELIEPVGHSWSSCDDGLISLRQCIICSRWGSKPDSSLLYRQRMCGCQEVSLPASWTMMRRCYSKQQTRSRWRNRDEHTDSSK